HRHHRRHRDARSGGHGVWRQARRAQDSARERPRGRRWLGRATDRRQRGQRSWAPARRTGRVAMTLGAHTRNAFAQAAAGVRAAPMPSIVAVFALALGAILFGTVYIAAKNAQSMLRAWGEGVQLTIYLAPDSAPARGAAVAESLRRVPSIEHVRYI